MSEEKEPLMLQPFCNEHQRKIVVAAKQGPNGRWRLAIVAANLLMVGPLLSDEGILARADQGKDADGKLKLDVPTMNLIFAELGCPGCARKNIMGSVLAVLRKGLDHAVAVSKREATDPDYSW